MVTIKIIAVCLMLIFAHAAKVNYVDVCRKLTSKQQCATKRNCRWEKHVEILVPEISQSAGNILVMEQSKKSSSGAAWSPSKKSARRPTKSPSEPTMFPSRRPTKGKKPAKPTRLPTRKPLASRSPTTKAPVTPTVAKCLPRCGVFAKKVFCPPNLGCDWVQSRCKQVRGKSTRKPSQAPVSPCRFSGEVQTLANSIEELRFSPTSGKYLAATTFSNASLLYRMDGLGEKNDVAQPQLIKVLQGHAEIVVHAAFTFEETHVATCSLDRTARIYETDSGNLTAVLEGVHTGPIVDLCFPHVRGNDILVTASHDSTAAVWNITNGQFLHRFVAHAGPLSGCHFFPGDSFMVATGSFDSQVMIWDIRSGKTKMNLTHNGPIYTIAISHDGQLIAGASKDISIWKTRNGEKAALLNRHWDIVRSITFSPDNGFLLSLAVEDSPILWDLLNPDHYQVLGLETYITGASFISNGRLVTVDRIGMLTWVASSATIIPLAQASRRLWTVAAHQSSSMVVSGSFEGSLVVYTC